VRTVHVEGVLGSCSGLSQALRIRHVDLI